MCHFEIELVIVHAKQCHQFIRKLKYFFSIKELKLSKSQLFHFLQVFEMIFNRSHDCKRCH